MFKSRTGCQPAHIFSPVQVLLRNCLIAIIALAAISCIFALVHAPAMADTPGASQGEKTASALEQNRTVAKEVVSSDEPEPASVLLAALTENRSSIARLEFQPDAVLVTDNDHDHSHWSVNASGAETIRILQLALEARPPVPFSAHASPPEEQHEPNWLVPVGLLLIVFVVWIIRNQDSIGSSVRKLRARTDSTSRGAPPIHIQSRQVSLRHTIDFTDLNTQKWAVRNAKQLVLVKIRTGAGDTAHALWDVGLMHCQLGAAPEREMSQDEKRSRAVHKLGHAIVSFVMSGEVPFLSTSILEADCFQPINYETFVLTKRDLLIRIATALGGAAAQQLYLSQVDQAGHNDVGAACRLARLLITEVDMCYLGDLSSAHEQALLADELRNAENIITQHERQFNALLLALLERGSLSNIEFVKVWRSVDATAFSQQH